MVFGLLLILGGVLFLGFIVGNYRKRNKNPYIELHKAKMHNEAQYDAYLKWAIKNAHGLPLPKAKFPGEQNFDSEIKNILK